MAQELTEPQRQSLDQLMSLTEGSDPQVATSVLQSVDWDVQVGIIRIYILFNAY
jgi:hypothetical protein